MPFSAYVRGQSISNNLGGERIVKGCTIDGMNGDSNGYSSGTGAIPKVLLCEMISLVFAISFKLL